MPISPSQKEIHLTGKVGENIHKGEDLWRTSINQIFPGIYSGLSSIPVNLLLKFSDEKYIEGDQSNRPFAVET